MAQLTEQQKKDYWSYNLRLTLILLAIWFVIAYILSGLLAGALNQVSFLGFPFGYYMAAQGSLIIFVVMLFLFAKQQDKIDREFGFAEED